MDSPLPGQEAVTDQLDPARAVGWNLHLSLSLHNHSRQDADQSPSLSRKPAQLPHWELLNRLHPGSLS